MLTWLWLLLWLTATPGAHARVVNPAESAPALVAATAEGHQHGHDLAGLHFRSVRASRRLDFSSIPTDPLVGMWCFDAGVARREYVCESNGCSDAFLTLASGWQFLQRTALSPRAPSFVS
jgi:hypothetical protein